MATFSLSHHYPRVCSILYSVTIGARGFWGTIKNSLHKSHQSPRPDTNHWQAVVPVHAKKDKVQEGTMMAVFENEDGKPRLDDGPRTKRDGLA
jgi:hypothetical protein